MVEVLDHTVIQHSLWRRCRMVRCFFYALYLICVLPHNIHNIYGCTVPGPVSSLSATTAVTQLFVSWNPPSVPNGVIIVYELLLSGNGTTNSSVNSTTIPLTLTQLPPNTTFTFSVRAYTIIGPGEYVTGQATTDSVPIVIPSSTPNPGECMKYNKNL